MKYDAIVIGAGHNGLSTAIILSRHGKKVGVFERLSGPGGLARCYEFHPGYETSGILADTSCVSPTTIKKLNLTKFGLSMENEKLPVHILSKNGSGITLFADRNKTVDSIRKISTEDADAYIAYSDFIRKISGFISGLMGEQQPDISKLGAREYWKLLRKGWSLKKLGKKTIMEFLKVGPMCAADFLNEKFENELLKSGIVLPAVIGSFTGPWSSYTTLNLLCFESMSQTGIKGGSSALIKALNMEAKENGVDIVCDMEVDKIILSMKGIVEGVKLKSGEEIMTSNVISSISPKALFLNLLKSNETGPKLESEVNHLRSRGTTAKLNLALDRKIRWKSEIPVEFARTGTSIDEIEKAFDSIKYGEFSKYPALDIHIPTVSDSNLAPEGHEIVSILASFVPYDLKGGWNNATRGSLEKTIINTLSEYVDGLNESIVGSELLTPVDIENRYNIPGGNIFHLEHALDQMIGRPVPACSQYETPIPGLFITGSGSHPGGRITCIPGILAAEKILERGYV